MSNKAKLAMEYFSNPNTNCAQATFCAFCDEAKISKEMAMKIATGFGGGLRDKEACGAVTGAIMALGLILGQKDENDLESKQLASDLTIEFNKKFKEKHGSIVCRDLKDDEICAQLVADGAQIMDDLLKARV
ncbi:MAG: C-GCAxxG-C-C family protein [Eubacteriales bacterium]